MIHYRWCILFKKAYNILATLIFVGVCRDFSDVKIYHNAHYGLESGPIFLSNLYLQWK